MLTQISLTILIFNIFQVISNENQNVVKICEEPNNILEASRILNWVDFNVDPCEDSLKFACGKFFNQTVHNDRYRKISLETIVEDKVQEQRRRILSSNVEEDDIDPIKLAKRFFWICTYTIPIDFRKAEPLVDLLRSIGGWPVLDGDAWKDENFNIEQIVREHPSFLRFFFDVFVRDSSIIRVDRPAYEVKVGTSIFTLNEKTKNNYLSYMIDSALLLGIPRNKVVAELTEAVDFLVNVTDHFIQWKFKRYKSFAEINKDFANDSLPGILDAIFNDEMRQKITQIRVDTNYVDFVKNAMAAVPKRVVANAYIWLIVENAFQYLPKRYQAPNLKFKRQFDATLKDVQRWERCMDYTNGFLQYAVDALYAKHYINNERKSEVRKFYEQIREDFINNIQSSVWANQTIRDEFVQKVMSFIPIIGFRDEILNETNLINNYKHFLPIDGLGNKKTYVTAKYFDARYRKVHPLEGIQFFELALIMEDRKYLGAFRKLIDQDLLNFKDFFEYFIYNSIGIPSERLTPYVYLHPRYIHKYSLNFDLPNYILYASLGDEIANSIYYKLPFGFDYIADKANENDCEILYNRENVHLNIASCLYRSRYGDADCYLPSLQNLTMSQIFWVKKIQNNCFLDKKEPETQFVNSSVLFTDYKKDFFCKD